MSRDWGPLNARARGLGAHLLSRRELEGLARAGDLRELADGLRALGFAVRDGLEVGPVELERAVRRRGAASLATLSRWTGPRADAAAVLFEDEDRRNLRAIMRGAAAGAEPDERLAGTLPTPSLPERALQELARQRTPRAAAALLAAWRHPYGTALLAVASPGEPDLLRLELALNRRFAERVLRLAGHGPLSAYLRETLDLENAFAAIVLAGRPEELAPRDAFIAGGQRVALQDFEEAVATAHPERAAARLARAFGDSPLARVIERAGADPATAEAAALRVRLAAQRRAARRDPLGPAPLLAFVLGMHAQAMDVRRLLWGRALAVPPALATQDLVTAP